MAAGAQMWWSEMFTKDQMVAWEGKPMAGMTWMALQDYFTEKWLERKQYSATTAKQSCFKEAALHAQETAAAKEEGETPICNATGPAHQTNHTDGGSKQNEYALDDGADERTHYSSRGPTNTPARQGEHTSDRQRQTPHRRRRARQKAKGEKDAMPPLKNVRPPQA
jgi:hypothetical protein